MDLDREGYNGRIEDRLHMNTIKISITRFDHSKHA